VLCLARAAAAVLGDDGWRALEHTREAIAGARSEGYVLWEADARLVAVEATFATGHDGFAAALDAFEELTSSFAPSRYDAEVAWFRELAKGKGADAAVLDALASSADAGAAARRSRALLGTAGTLDQIDRRVVERARARLGLESLPRAVASPRPGLGLDTTQGRVVLPGGRSVDLSARPMLMRLLTALFEAGGEATKEALVAAVWGIAEYHPLRDDKRLQVAVRRLRVLLEDDVLETTEAGYRFAPGLPVYRTSPGV
jgi:hypothetical protein